MEKQFIDVVPIQNCTGPFQRYPVSLWHSDFFVLITATRERQHFSLSIDGRRRGSPHVVSRKNVYQDVMALYRSSYSSLIKEYPLRVRFEGEMALDAGGVCRDMFTAFWEQHAVKSCSLVAITSSQLCIPKWTCPSSVFWGQFSRMGTSHVVFFRVNWQHLSLFSLCWDRSRPSTTGSCYAPS